MITIISYFALLFASVLFTILTYFVLLKIKLI